MGVNPSTRELLGAYALDAVDADEVTALEEFVAQDHDAARELERLRTAAAWIGATEAIEPPRDLRAQLLAQARPVPEELRVYRMAVARHEELLDELPDDALELPTANGLAVGELVVHLASMESAVAETIGLEATVTDETDVDRRTAHYLEALGADPVAGRAVWRVASESLDAWAAAGGTIGGFPWQGAFDVERRTLLAARAFELWTHDDDLRVALGRERLTPTMPELALMSDVAVGILPLCLLAKGEQVSASAHIVLTGDGGGEWDVSLDGREHAQTAVTLTMDVVDFCRLVADRLDPATCGASIEGDETLGHTLVGCASALATL